MEYAGLIALVVVIGLFLISKIKSFIFKAKDQALVKEDENLKAQQTMLENEISKMKENLSKPVEDLTPEQVEEFWKDDKK